MTRPRGRGAGSARAAAGAPDLFAEAPQSTPHAEPPPVHPATDPGATAGAAISVAALTRTAREVVEGAFPPLWVRGEVYNFTAHRNGHWYFSLRDDAAQIRCVVWARDQRRIPAPPDDGMQVAALGQLSVYPARGEMQFVITAMEAAGDGLWRKALEIAMARLAADGLLAAERKRPLVPFPRRVAVVTSPDGAALRDIIAVIRRRCPTVEIVVAPAKVQGDGAAEELVAAIERVGRWADADTLIVGRGGGSREDLWAFNDERVARALAVSPIPTISAVGHEVDVSLCDLVADVRAATPSAAAEAAVPVLADERTRLRTLGTALRAGLERRATNARRRAARAALDLRREADRVVERRRARLESAAGRLQALSPLRTLARGYAVARDEAGRTLADAGDFEPGRDFTLTLRDGSVRATAREVRPAAPNLPER